jgi:hypothetical protein
MFRLAFAIGYCITGLAVFYVVVKSAEYVVSKAFGQSGHERFHHYYLHWKQPGTTVSCCNARVNQGGVEVGDCEPTRYEMRNGDWYAWHRQQDKWIKVPDDRLLRERNPSGEEGHLCSVNHSGQWVILCAVPPDVGG